jgi:hypothetical protein
MQRRSRCRSQPPPSAVLSLYGILSHSRYLSIPLLFTCYIFCIISSFSIRIISPDFPLVIRCRPPSLPRTRTKVLELSVEPTRTHRAFLPHSHGWLVRHSHVCSFCGHSSNLSTLACTQRLSKKFRQNTTLFIQKWNECRFLGGIGVVFSKGVL